MGEDSENVVVGTGLCSADSYDWFVVKPIHQEIIDVLKKHNLNIGQAERALRDIEIVLKKMKLSEIV